MRLRYSLRGLFALLTLAGVILGIYVHQVRRVGEEVALTTELANAWVGHCGYLDDRPGRIYTLLGLAPAKPHMFYAEFYFHEANGDICRAFLPRLCKLPCLTHLSLRYPTDDDESLTYLCRDEAPGNVNREHYGAADGLFGLKPMRALRKLEIFGAKLPPHFVSPEFFPALQKLSLDSSDCADGALINIARFPSLRSLDFENTLATNRGMIAISGMRHLRELNCSVTFVNEDALDAISKLSKLQTLTFRELQTDGGKLSRLAANKALETLDLSWDEDYFCTRCRPEHRDKQHTTPPQLDISGLAAVKTLRCLFLGRRQLTGTDALKSLVALNALGLDDTNVDDDTLHAIEGLGEIEYLGLQRTNVSDVGLRSCAAFPRLRELYLGGTKITDHGIDTLLTMRGLEELDVSYTQLSLDAIAKLGRMPNLKMLFVSKGVPDAVVTAMTAINPRISVVKIDPSVNLSPGNPDAPSGGATK